ncbi:MAG: hypothetical protein ABIR71_05360, partial [Chthoniobacterales bacterium]
MKKPKTTLLCRAAFCLLWFLLFTTLPAAAQSRDGNAPQAAEPDTLFNCSWSAAAVYPITVLDNPMTAVGSNLYSFGGVSTAITGSSYKFDGTSWTPIAPLPV